MDGPRPATRTEVELALDLITREQQRADRAISYVGEGRDEILAELDELAPPWRKTLRVVVEDARVVGAAAIEWVEDVSRAWVMGPWVDASGEAWVGVAERLLRACVEQLPDGLRDVELCGFVEHDGLAGLASRSDLERSAVSHVLVVTDEVVATWPDPVSSVRVRDATADDLGAVQRLHAPAFPGTHTPADVLVAGAGTGRRTVLVATLDGVVVGYAAGQVQADGEGYIDYVAVAEQARGRGAGRALLVHLGRRTAATGRRGRVALTVEDSRAAARGLYASLGFSAEGSIVGYRTPAAGR